MKTILILLLLGLSVNNVVSEDYRIITSGQPPADCGMSEDDCRTFQIGYGTSHTLNTIDDKYSPRGCHIEKGRSDPDSLNYIEPEILVYFNSNTESTEECTPHRDADDLIRGKPCVCKSGATVETCGENDISVDNTNGDVTLCDNVKIKNAVLKNLKTVLSGNSNLGETCEITT